VHRQCHLVRFRAARAFLLDDLCSDPGNQARMSGKTTAPNDDAFVAFCFAIVSCVAFVMFAPVLWQGVSSLFSWARKFGKHSAADSASGTEGSWLRSFDDVAYAASLLRTAISDSHKLRPLVEAFSKHRRLVVWWIAPRVLRFFFRPRILVTVLWLALFSSVLYTTLTYDPYAALGLDATASSFRW
jgi:hypothetical protein